MRLPRHAAAFPLILLPALLGCSRGGDATEARRPLRPALRSIQVHVFDRTCVRAGCHLGSEVESRLSLRAGESRGGLVGAPSTQVRDLLLVKPGDPEGSYLIRKLEGGRMVGDRMPLGASPLPPETIAVIREWIARGAPD